MPPKALISAKLFKDKNKIKDNLKITFSSISFENELKCCKDSLIIKTLEMPEDPYYDDLSVLYDFVLQTDQSQLTRPFVDKRVKSLNYSANSDTENSSDTEEINSKDAVSLNITVFNSEEENGLVDETDTGEDATSDFTNTGAATQVKMNLSTITGQNNANSEKPPYRYVIKCSLKPSSSVCQRRIVVKAVEHLKADAFQTQCKAKCFPKLIKDMTSLTPSIVSNRPTKNKCSVLQPNKTEIANCNKDDRSESSDDERGDRVNRRLQVEKPKSIKAKDTLHNMTTNNLQTTPKFPKASAMWENVLKTPQLWKEEKIHNVHMKMNQEVIVHTSGMLDYHEMLEEFVSTEDGEVNAINGETLYETMFEKKLQEPNYKSLISEFYIPPAQVEVFYQKFTDDMAVQDCLQKVCLVRNWPNPTYTRELSRMKTSAQNEFFVSCNLKSIKFVPAKSASNEHLAKELAASYCFRWLGLSQRKLDSNFSEFVNQTYF